MPNIPTYEAPQLGLQPSETGIDALQQAARRTGAFYSEAGELVSQTGARYGSAIKSAGDAAVQVAEHQDVSRKSVEFANLQATLTDKWKDFSSNADPNDPTVAAKFRQEVLEPELDKFSNEGTLTQGGQNFAQNHAIALRQHFFEKTASDMSTLAGVAATENFATVGNRLASTARIDPSSLDFQLKMADTTLGAQIDSSPNLTPAERARLKTEGVLKIKEGIVKSAVMGMIERNPNIDLSKIEEKYGDLIPGPEMQLFQKNVKAQNRADAAAQKQDLILKRQLADENVHQQLNKNFSDNVTVDPQTGQVKVNPAFFKNTLDIVRNNPNAPIAAQAGRTYLDWGESQQNKEAKPVDDPETRQFNIDHMFDPEYSSDKMQLKILTDEAQGKLTRTTAAVQMQLAKQLGETPLKGPVWQDTMKALHAQLVVSVPNLGPDAVGEANYANVVQNFIPKYLAAVRSGNVPHNALDLNDPNSMISQSIPSNYKRTVVERANDMSKALGGVNLTGPNTTITGVSVQPAKPPEVGTVKNGFRFKGGNPALPASWEKVQ